MGLIAILAILAVLQFTAGHSVTAVEKMTPQEVISKHLEAVGPQETRDSIKTRTLTGECIFSQKNGQAGGLQGPALIASEGKKVLIGANFGL